MEFINFVKTIASLGCLPQLIIASLCLLTMLGLAGYGVVSAFKEINNG